ncbi:MAG: hypothetical protein ACFFCM_06490 [Promethearchaeota archaeon]
MQDRKTIFEKTSLHPPFFGYASPLKLQLVLKIINSLMAIQFLYKERQKYIK